MDARLTALKLVLDAIGESSDISSVSERLRVQKAVYLTQVLGLNLGYSYSWYLKGPYSTSLTQDYYQLADAQRQGDAIAASLKNEVISQLARVKGLLEKPANVTLQKEQWYELLASLHYLMKSSRQDFAQASATIAANKPHLSGWLAAGRQRLTDFGLI